LNLFGQTGENHKNFDQVSKYMGRDFKKISPSKNPELYKQLGAGLRVQLHLLREVNTSLDWPLKQNTDLA